MYSSYFLKKKMLLLGLGWKRHYAYMTIKGYLWLHRYFIVVDYCKYMLIKNDRLKNDWHTEQTNREDKNS